MAIVRSLSRLYVSGVDAGLADLRRFTNAPVRLRFRHGALELASIGDLLLVGGDEASLAPFRATQATALTNDLDGVLAICRADGDEIVAGPSPVPTGRNMTVRHLSGAVIEYVEWQADKVSALTS